MTLLRRHHARTDCKLLCAGTLLFPLLAQAEPVPGTAFSLDLQSAQLAATGRSISVFRAPVTDAATGTTTYYDATFQFGVLADGSLGFTRVSSVAASTSTLRAADSFIAGNYKDTAGNTFVVSGPVALAGGRYSYSINCTTAGKLWTATWVTGPVSGHPNITAAKPNESAAGAFGIFGTSNFNLDGLAWNSGYLVGATQQSPTVITITGFSLSAVAIQTSAFTRTN